MNNCKKCKNKYSGNYCPNCGNPTAIPRINGQYILKDIKGVLYFDKGILFTIRELLLRPGSNVRIFIKEDRNRLVKPLLFLILCSLIYSLANYFLHFEDEYLGEFEGDSTPVKMFVWIRSNYGYANIFMGLFIGVWTKIFFRKAGYNLYEILILIFFIMGIGMLGYAIFGIVEGLFGLKVFQIGSVILIFYSSWAIGTFFNKSKASSYIKAFFAYILGSVTSILFIVLIGMLIDLFIR